MLKEGDFRVDILQGFALCGQDAGEKPWIHRGRRHLPRPRHRRHQRHFQRGARGPPATPRLPRPRPTGASVYRVPKVSQWRFAPILDLAARIRRTEARSHLLGIARRLDHRRGQPRGRSRSHSRHLGQRHRRPLPVARRIARTRPRHHSAGRRAGRDPP